MSDRYDVVIGAKNVASAAFKDVARDGETMGQALKRAGDQGSLAIDKLEKSTTNWNRVAFGVGSTIGAITVAGAHLADESKRSSDALEAAVTAAGDNFGELEDDIDRLNAKGIKLAFDDEDTQDTLTQLIIKIGDTETAMRDLALVQDIARAPGQNLANAIALVTAAEQERFSALKRSGIVLDETATKEEALAALQTKFAGQAEAYADSQAADLDRIMIKLGNYGETIGGALGDIQGPLLALSAGTTVLGGLGDALDAVGGKAKLASAATAAMNLAMGPAGLVAGIGLAAGGLLYLMTRQSDTEKQTIALAQATDDYTKSIQNNTTALIQSGNYQVVNATKLLLDQVIANGAIAQERINDVGEAIALVKEIEMQGLGAGASLDAIRAQVDMEDYTASVLAMSDANRDGVLSSEELAAAQAILTDSVHLTTDEATRLTEALNQWDEEIIDPQFDGKDLSEDIQQVVSDVANGFISVEEGINRINNINLDDYNFALREAEANTASWGNATAGITEQVKDMRMLTVAAFNAHANAIDDTTDSWFDQERAVQAAIDGAEAHNNAILRLDEGLKLVSTGAEQSGNSLFTWMENATIAAQAAEELQKRINDFRETMSDASPADGLDRSMRIIVGNTDAIVGSIGAAQEWADALIAPIGTWSTLNDLLASGKIDQEDYNEAQQAQVDITLAHARALEASQVLQIKQADIIAQDAEATADYIEGLADLDEASQQVALGWADQNEALRVNQTLALMAAAANGEMSDAQQDALEATTLAAAKTDSTYAAMLRDLGVLKGDLDNPESWTLDFSVAEGGRNALTDLTDTIKELVETLREIYELKIDDGDMVIANDLGQSLIDKMNELDGKDATVEVALSASSYAAVSVISFANDLMNELDGKTATTYINTIHTDGVHYRHGGVIAEARHGMAVDAGREVLVGEDGPERVLLPPGSLVTPHSPGNRMYNRGGGLTINNPVIYITPQSGDLYGEIYGAALMESRGQ